MVSSLIAKRFFSSSLLSKSIIHPTASSSRSFNTNAMRNYDDQNDDVERRSEFSSPRIACRDDIFLDVLDPFFPTRSLSRVLNMMDQFMDNSFLSTPRGIGAGAGVRRGWNMRETEDALLLRVDMPGLGQEEEICVYLYQRSSHFTNWVSIWEFIDVGYRNLGAKRTCFFVGFLTGRGHGVTLWPRE
ncbi:23.6 kDa heat shock protein, mitochondrial-like [Vigna radiata var. radiata]|uniref:23.6 kDa heat shock protein, mitochondrial-like n=1 Tax=Vigna radiata var. radiata TaxID=3916 RepID=A0A3Q0FDS2_VIGRR|nr:23.6 kDa heat shock protein, mitochondrial-like [Vigna radiata var. radiata]